MDDAGEARAPAFYSDERFIQRAKRDDDESFYAEALDIADADTKRAVVLRVSHAKFGEGSALAIRDDKADVKFDSGETKTVLRSLLRER